MSNTVPVPQVLLDMRHRFPEVVSELLDQVQIGLPSLALSAADAAKPKKQRDVLLKNVEKAAVPNFRLAIAIAIEDGDTVKADDLIARLDHTTAGVPEPREREGA